jgi:hypothetical protein
MKIHQVFHSMRRRIRDAQEIAFLLFAGGKLRPAAALQESHRKQAAARERE